MPKIYILYTDKGYVVDVTVDGQRHLLPCANLEHAQTFRRIFRRYRP